MKRLSQMREELNDLLEMHSELERRWHDSVWMAVYLACQRMKITRLLEVQNRFEQHIRDGLYGVKGKPSACTEGRADAA